MSKPLKYVSMWMFFIITSIFHYVTLSSIPVGIIGINGNKDVIYMLLGVGFVFTCMMFITNEIPTSRETAFGIFFPAFFSLLWAIAHVIAIGDLQPSIHDPNLNHLTHHLVFSLLGTFISMSSVYVSRFTYNRMFK